MLRFSQTRGKGLTGRLIQGFQLEQRLHHGLIDRNPARGFPPRLDAIPFGGLYEAPHGVFASP
jgi:hypothetical protein